MLSGQYEAAVRDVIDELRATVESIEEDENGRLKPDVGKTARARINTQASVAAVESVWRAWARRLDRVHQYVDEYFETAEGTKQRPSAPEQELVAELKGLWPQDGRPGSGTAGRFYQLSVHHRQELANAVTRHVLGRTRKSQLVKELTEHGVRSKRQAEQLVRDSTIQFSRSVQAHRAEELGYEYFQYFGPDDRITRPFCDPLVGQVFSREEIDDMDNGQTGAGSVMVAGGGYNCRHHWQPVKREWFEDEEWADVTSTRVEEADPASEAAAALISGEEVDDALRETLEDIEARFSLVRPDALDEPKNKFVLDDAGNRIMGSDGWLETTEEWKAWSRGYYAALSANESEMARLLDELRGDDDSIEGFFEFSDELKPQVKDLGSIISRDTVGPMRLPTATELRQLEERRGYFGVAAHGTTPLKIAEVGQGHGGEYDPQRNEIRLRNDNKRTIFHEVGHWLEDRNLNILDASRHILWRRAAQRNGTWDSDVPDSEKYGKIVPWDEDRTVSVIDGGFYDSYAGWPYVLEKGPDGSVGARRYSGLAGISRETAMRLFATEVTSTALESLRSPVGMAELWMHDPEQFAHAINVAKGRYGYRSPFDDL